MLMDKQKESQVDIGPLRRQHADPRFYIEGTILKLVSHMKFTKKFKPRFAIIRDGFLYYAVDEVSTTRGVMSLASSEVKKITSKQHPYVLEITKESFAPIQFGFKDDAELNEFEVVLQTASTYEKTFLTARVSAAITIQRRWRGVSQRAKYPKEIAAYRAARSIQRICRGLLARVNFKKSLQSVVYIQSSVRRWVVRSRLEREQQAATRIQSVFRMHRDRKTYLVSLRAVIRVQARIRAWSERAKFKVLLSSFRRRTKVAAELLSTEQTFNASLHTLMEEFAMPLFERAANPKTAVASAAEINSIFQYIGSCMKVSNQLLASLVQGIENDWGPSTRVAPLLRLNMEALRDFAPYVNDYDNITAALDVLLKRESFQQAVEEAAHSERAGGLNIQSHLITPVQRIPRLLLLSRDLQKCTWESHTDKQELTVAQEELQEVLSFINEGKRQCDNKAKMAYLDRKLVHAEASPVAVMNSGEGRDFINEGKLDLLIISDDGLEVVKHKPRFFFLFDDMLLYTKQFSSKKGFLASTMKYEFKDALKLSDYKFTTVTVQNERCLCLEHTGGFGPIFHYLLPEGPVGQRWITSFESSKVIRD